MTVPVFIVKLVKSSKCYCRSARSNNTTDEESCAEDFEFAEGSAQFWVSRNVGDGIVLPKDTRDTLDRDYECAILR